MTTTCISPVEAQRWSGALVLAAALVAAPAAWGSTASRADETGGDVERLIEWPELKGSAKADAKKDVQRLRKAKTFEMGEQARDALIEVGAAVVPLLLPAYGKEKDSEARERIVDVLSSVTDASHTRLLAEAFEDRALVVRVWAMERVALFPDPGVREAAEKRLEAIAGTPEKPARKEADPGELYAASLAAASTGSLAGLDHLFAAARDDWKERGDGLLVAVRALRGEAATNAVFERMGDERKDIVAGLRLLWACGDKATGALAVGKYLDNEDHQIRSAAINALRCIVDDDEPLRQMPVFEAIERAKKWKARL